MALSPNERKMEQHRDSSRQGKGNWQAQHLGRALACCSPSLPHKTRMLASLSEGHVCSHGTMAQALLHTWMPQQKKNKTRCHAEKSVEER